MKRGRDDLLESRGISGQSASQNLSKRHQLTMKARESLSVEGIVNVESFDDQEVIVETDLGVMHVRGEDLHIKELNLTSGSLHISGFVQAIEYKGDGPRKKGGKGFFGRLLK